MQIHLPSGQTVQLQHIQWFVIGACYDYLTSTGQQHLRDNPDEFHAFNQRVIEKVVAHLRGKSPLNASYSDFECIVSSKAVELFKDRG